MAKMKNPEVNQTAGCVGFFFFFYLFIYILYACNWPHKFPKVIKRIRLNWRRKREVLNAIIHRLIL